MGLRESGLRDCIAPHMPPELTKAFTSRFKRTQDQPHRTLLQAGFCLWGPRLRPYLQIELKIKPGMPLTFQLFLWKLLSPHQYGRACWSKTHAGLNWFPQSEQSDAQPLLQIFVCCPIATSWQLLDMDQVTKPSCRNLLLWKFSRRAMCFLSSQGNSLDGKALGWVY